MLSVEDIKKGKGDLGSEVALPNGNNGHIVGYGYEGEGNNPDPFLCFVRDTITGGIFGYDHPDPKDES